ncbi:hypothetical protein AB0L88_33225 [Saccharopolyspora shandongensis]|uniref:Excreted virulence factor EspC, type VII ESX diderm n=1 Tax=Saccharopolyspora shandongensis TaxID=418495 RepID=A0A1H3IWX5_9PSEU|nr:hypothetical protein [Saccharopolyspora shandongensis]SDY32220.1 hypothetical protein SAMN05216215_102450 [Saccharopolyspora shandongensis]
MTDNDAMRVDVVELGKAASVVAGIADECAGYAELAGVAPNAGDLPAGKWLQDLLAERRDEVAAHCQRLERVFRELSERMARFATDVQALDQHNGSAVKSLGDGLADAFDGAVRGFSSDPVVHQV